MPDRARIWLTSAYSKGCVSRSGEGKEQGAVRNGGCPLALVEAIDVKGDAFCSLVRQNLTLWRILP